MTDAAIDCGGPRKTLIICPIGLGNFIMATPAIELLSRQIGRENLHLLALKPGIKAMAEATGYFAEVHSWDPDKEGMGRGLGVLKGLRSMQFDYSLSLFPTGDWKFVLFGFLAGARRRIGFAYPNSGLPKLMQSKSYPLDVKLHDTDQNYGMMERALGVAEDGPRRTVFAFPAEHPEMETLRQERYFVCHPGSSAERGMKEKRLPPRAFADVIRMIHREFGLKCLLIGGPEEAELRAEIETMAPHAFIDYKSRNLNELAALIDPAQFYMGNDSGLMHVSVALGKRCIAFFGPTDDRRNGPYSDGLRREERGYHLIVRRDDLDCTPCWTIHTIGANPPCKFGDTRCLKQMDGARIWPKVKAYLSVVLKEGSGTKKLA